MKFHPTSLKDARLIKLFRQEDDRGVFFKPFHYTTLEKEGIHFEAKESICSVSKKDVVRGMHFQKEPYAQAKVVYCPHGAILDVILDIRPESETYGKFEAFELSSENGHALYIPEGFAHGFLALTNDAITSYIMNREYQPESDAGILWDSFGFEWPVETPIISVRDLAFGGLGSVRPDNG